MTLTELCSNKTTSFLIYDQRCSGKFPCVGTLAWYTCTTRAYAGLQQNLYQKCKRAHGLVKISAIVAYFLSNFALKKFPAFIFLNEHIIIVTTPLLCRCTYGTIANLTVINPICIIRAPREPWDRADIRESYFIITY